MLKYFYVALLGLLPCAAIKAQTAAVYSPNKQIKLSFTLANGQMQYSISYAGAQVLAPSKLGLTRADADFNSNLQWLGASAVQSINQHYQLQSTKRRLNHYVANKQVFSLKNATGLPIDVTFQVSDDGVAFRYTFPDSAADVKTLLAEATTFHFDTQTIAWMQPLANSKEGWALASPSYEEFYLKGIPVGTPSPISAGWVYPALFKTGNNWVAITETWPEKANYCLTHLAAQAPNGEYAIQFANPKDVFTDGIVGPQASLPWNTPWRVIAIGSLNTIMQSTLGTDVAPPAVSMDSRFIKPGKASWSWVLLKDDKTTYPVQQQFIDYAADMHWPYCLIDALWDTQIGYDKVQQLADYAKTKNVGLLLWYNSAGSWNQTPQTPRNKLLTHQSRVAEFSLLQKMGIKGLKIDFFGGDGQSMVQYYVDILNDARDYGLLVNFHGTTLPRGLERQYPNLLTMEAIRGMEYATFEQKNLDEQPTHCTTAPFTRNLFDPMDYTPMALYQVPHLQRRTTAGFELALPVVFQSGIQHLAETPQGMSHMPAYVKTFLQQLPNQWDDIKYIDGYPGKLVVLARRSGQQWYIAAINGEAQSKTINVDLSFLQGSGYYITDGQTPNLFSQGNLKASKSTSITLQANGGLVAVFNALK